MQYPSISDDGSRIVFLLDYKITCLDPATGKVTEPQITVADNDTEMRRSFKDQKPAFVAVSPDGKKLALSVRGLLYVSDAEGKYLKLLPTPVDERVDEIVWADNRTLYYSRTDKGYVNLFKIGADGSSAEKQVYRAEANIQSLTRSHKGDKIAFISGSREVMVLDVAKDKARKIADSQFWSFRSYRMNFSFDDAYLAFEGMNLFEGDIFIYSFKDKSLHNLTNSASSEGAPVFSPDGKNLYLTANIYGSSFPRGGMRGQLYRLPLQRYDQEPFASDVYDELFAEEGAGDSTASEMTIDYKEVFRRLEEMPENGGDILPALTRLLTISAEATSTRSISAAAMPTRSPFRRMWRRTWTTSSARYSTRAGPCWTRTSTMSASTAPTGRPRGTTMPRCCPTSGAGSICVPCSTICSAS